MTAQKHTPNESREYPKRIWAGHLGGGRRIWKPELMHESEKAFACQYVRADIVDEMLGALKECLPLFDMVTALDDHGSNALGQAENLIRSAIAKATGQ